MRREEVEIEESCRDIASLSLDSFSLSLAFFLLRSFPLLFFVGDFRHRMDAEELNFEFAFDSSNFSDRILRVEIIEGPHFEGVAGEGKGKGKGKDQGQGEDSSITDWIKPKRVREDRIRWDKDGDFAVCNDDRKDVNCNQSFPEICETLGSHDGENVLLTEEDDEEDAKSAGDAEDVTIKTDLPLNMECEHILRVKEVYVSSPILAAKSPFFYKLFSNGMKESDQRHATLRICESEEGALLDILRYMYTGKLTCNSAPELLTILIIADKFEISSCMRDCSKLLSKLPMTLEFALHYLELPCSVSMATAVQPLIDAAREYLATRYMNVLKFQDELMELPLAAIQSILSSDNVYVASEDVLYDFVIRWVRLRYPILAERRQVFCAYLCPLIRFPMMSCRKLRKVLQLSELFSEFATKIVLEALFFKADAPHRQRTLARADTYSHRFIERTYKYRPVKMVEFEYPNKQCIVYLDLQRSECSKLYPSGRVYSQAFHIDGQGFFLSAHCNMDQQNTFHCFGLFLGMQDRGASSLTVDYEFAARAQDGDHADFVSKYKGYYTFTGGKAVGYRNLFAIPWATFMSEDSQYFINDVIHLRAELTIKCPQPGDIASS